MYLFCPSRAREEEHDPCPVTVSRMMVRLDCSVPRFACDRDLRRPSAGAMQHLINFSTHALHLDQFERDWEKVRAFVNRSGLDGIELLIGNDPPSAVPADLVQGVHLPYWIRWLEIWHAGPDAAIPPEERRFLAGGARDATHMVALQQCLWRQAARLHPRYAVFHVSHVTLEESFTRCYASSAELVVRATIDLLNATAATFPDGEPPVRLWLENLWWPGLTFTSPALAEAFVERLRFENWGFVLDTGHLINTCLDVNDEDAAVDLVLEQVARLSPRVRARIEGLHLSLSLSGAYQRSAPGLPAGFADLPFVERYTLARDHVAQIDQHRPFTTPRCREIVSAVRPSVITHELLVHRRDELERNFSVQYRALTGAFPVGGSYATM